MTARPLRKKKHDRLMHSGVTEDEMRCDFAVAPLDVISLDMDRRWGVDRLPGLVSPELASRYGAAMAFLNSAIEARDATTTAAAAENCIKGLHAMDAEARRLGHQPIPAEVWVHTHEGQTFGVVRAPGDWPTLKASHPGLRLYTLNEVAVALAGFSPVVGAVKDAFPAAQITEIKPARSTLAEELDDEIPWQ